MNFVTGKIVLRVYRDLCILFIVSCFITNAFAQKAWGDSTVQKFYEHEEHHLFWFCSDYNRNRANEWLLLIESGAQPVSLSDQLRANQIRTALFGCRILDNRFKEQTDRQITGIIFKFLSELRGGDLHFDYDEVSMPCDSSDLYQLMNSCGPEPVAQLVSKLDCHDPAYEVLKNYLNDSITNKDTLKYKKVILAMNYCRYFTANHFPERIVVNIPEAVARYYVNDSLKLKMRAVVGKKRTPTPTIASYITNITTFPEWNVPRSIAVNEILPKVKKDENYLEQNSFDVVDKFGNEVDDSELNWELFNGQNFPYFFRQSTGADNSLGVLKFNLRSPFSIFLHSTNVQSSFKRDFRYLSHGCIRLENPFALADELSQGRIDLKELKSGRKNTEPNTIILDHKVPVFVIYQPVTVEGTKVTILTDVYKLIK